MGLTEVQATVIGENETRQYTFPVDTGSTYVALPPEEIAALSLHRRRMRVKLMSATGLVDVETYVADGELMGEDFTVIVVPTSTPLLGYELLQNLRFKVNPVTHEIEKVPDDVMHHPPYQL